MIKGSVEVALRAPAEIDVVAIQEAIALGQRVTAFRIEVRPEGGAGAAGTEGGWREVGRGQTIGYKRLVRFPRTTVSALRLSIGCATTNPCAPFPPVRHHEGTQMKLRLRSGSGRGGDLAGKTVV